MGLEPAVLEQMIPLVGILASLGLPVALLYIYKYFKLRNRELDAEIESRRFWSETERARFEARVDRLETALFQRGPLPDRSMLEAPPDAEAQARLPARERVPGK